MDCLDIIKQYLIDHGYDGLYSPGECACKVNDLAPCMETFSQCKPGFKHPGDCEDDDFYIGPKKVEQCQEN